VAIGSEVDLIENVLTSHPQSLEEHIVLVELFASKLEVYEEGRERIGMAELFAWGKGAVDAMGSKIKDLTPGCKQTALMEELAGKFDSTIEKYDPASE
jgi:hypothetical protein